MLLVVAKTGNIGCSTVLELLLDERAERGDVEIKVISSGAKMTPKEAEEVGALVRELKPELTLYSTPNVSAPGPRRLVEMLPPTPFIVISDAPGLKARELLEERGAGYIFVKADAMIGARREFLDPTEMAVFNADILKVLAATGVLRLIQLEIGRVIDGLKKGELRLPRLVVDVKAALAQAGYKNPYAAAKALAAFKMAELVGELNAQACFVEKSPERYIQMVAGAHELLRSAALLADEAREIEKQGDSVCRTPHNREGRVLRKTGLMMKPE